MATRSTDFREKTISVGGGPRPEVMPVSTGVPGSLPPSGPQIQPTRPAVPATGAPVTDPNSLDRFITPENTLRNQRLGFQVNAGGGAGGASGFERVSARDTSGSIGKMFSSQLPGLNLDFERQVEQLAARTAALGRTGAGLFNRDTGYVGDAARTARESLLGNLIFQSTQNDAQRALQAALGNQGAGVSIAGINSQAAIAGANRSMQADLARQGHLQYLQQREDQLAREAMADRQTQLALSQLGFQYQPTGSIGLAADAALQGAGNYGANAGTINQQLQDAASGAVQAWTRPQPSGYPTGAPPQSLPSMNVPRFEYTAPEWRAPMPSRPNFRADELGL